MATGTTEDIVKLFSEYPTICPICSSEDSSEYEKIIHHGIQLRYLICNICGLVFQSPRIPQNRVSEFYDSAYRLIYLGQSKPREHELMVQKKRAENLMNFLAEDQAFIPRCHLDIGCGSGALLLESRSRFGTKVVGIELDAAHREYVVENGIRVHESLDKWREQEATLANLVSLSHVLEHLTDPVSYLLHIREKVISSDGRLLIEVPNLFFHPSLELAHTFAFSITTLRNTLRRAGFSILRYKRHSTNQQLLSPFYITVLASPSPTTTSTPIQPDRYSRQRRDIGRKIVLIERTARRTWRKFKSKMR